MSLTELLAFSQIERATTKEELDAVLAELETERRWYGSIDLRAQSRRKELTLDNGSNF
jgi:hypothetical protein